MTGIKAWAVCMVCGAFLTAAEATAPSVLIGQTETVSNTDAASDLIRTITSEIFRTLGPLGILGWYLYRTTERHLPRKDAEIQAAQDKFTAEMQKERDHQDKVWDKIFERLDQQAKTIVTMIEHCETRQRLVKG